MLEHQWGLKTEPHESQTNALPLEGRGSNSTGVHSLVWLSKSCWWDLTTFETVAQVLWLVSCSIRHIRCLKSILTFFLFQHVNVHTVLSTPRAILRLVSAIVEKTLLDSSVTDARLVINLFLFKWCYFSLPRAVITGKASSNCKSEYQNIRIFNGLEKGTCAPNNHEQAFVHREETKD